MIISVEFAECDGCGTRVEGSDAPSTWLKVTRSGANLIKLFCSPECYATNHDLDLPDVRRSRAERLKLSERDVHVLNMIAAGKSNTEIGIELYLSDRTIKNLLTEHIFPVLHCHTRLEAVIIAGYLGIVDLSVAGRSIAGVSGVSI